MSQNREVVVTSTPIQMNCILTTLLQNVNKLVADAQKEIDQLMAREPELMLEGADGEVGQ